MSALSACRDLGKLNPTFRRKLLAVIDDLEGHGVDLLVTETYRSQERQDWLYAQGRTRPGPIVTWTRTSFHTTGKAADVCFLKGKRATYAGPWSLVQRSCQAHGLTWGGTFHTPDRPHIQLG